YFELHRGTYTSQAATKKYNRKLEFLLRDVEIAATLCLGFGRSGFKYPKEELDSLWKDLLLNTGINFTTSSQGRLLNSPISMLVPCTKQLRPKVLHGSHRGQMNSGHFREIPTIILTIKMPTNLLFDNRTRTCPATKLLDNSLHSLYQSSSQLEGGEARYVAFNTLAWSRSEILEVPVRPGDNLQQYSADKSIGYAEVENEGFSFKEISGSKAEKEGVRAFTEGQHIILENSWIVAKFNQQGHLIGLYDKQEVRELIPEGQAGNRLKFFEDVPLYWDAWDVEIYHLNTGRNAGTAKARIEEVGPLRATIIVNHTLSENSTAVQSIVLSAVSPRLDFHMEVEWHENRVILKAEFIWDICSDFATYDSQFGIVQRTTTYNTSHDYAKFEVCGHKFADLSEHGYGVALLNDRHHEFSFAIYPHKGTFHESNVVRESYQFNAPMVVKAVSQDARAERMPESAFKIEGARNVVLDTIKRAEDSDHVILRLHEAFGGRAMFKLKSVLDIQTIHRCNIMEDEGVPVDYNKNQKTSGWIILHAFEILTLKLKLK
ncbi:Glycoside hydrolase, 38 vacuolar alpha mannosidase, partial [Lobosporangium transversale]